jgi:uncharacterized membrane protein
MVFVLGSRLIGRVEALAGAAVLATSYHHVWFSQNARGYTMLGFFALLSTYLLIRAGETGRRREYVFYALACAAGVYTHLTMAFVVAGHAVVIIFGFLMRWRPVLRQPLPPLMWAWAGAALLSAVAYAPFGAGLAAHFGGVPHHESIRVATSSWAVAEAIRALFSGAGVPAALAGGIIALIGAASLLRRSPFVTALLVVPAIVTAAAIIAGGQPLRPRFFFFMSGAAAIFVGRGIGAIGEIRSGRSGRSERLVPIAVVTGALIAVSAVALPRNYQVPKQDFEGAVRFLTAEESAGARIAAAGPACLPLSDYFGKTGWRCLQSQADFNAFGEGHTPALVTYTLADYIEDPALRERLRTACPTIRTFPGTLGAGDLVVCAPRRPEAP